MSLLQWKTCSKATRLYTNSITTPTPRDEQKKYKFTTKNGQFFEELKVQSRTKIEQPNVGYNAEDIIKSLP
jgi:hypothetical protein